MGKLSDEIMREQFVKSGEWKLTSSKIEKSIEEFNKYHTRETVVKRSST